MPKIIYENKNHDRAGLYNVPQPPNAVSNTSYGVRLPGSTDGGTVGVQNLLICGFYNGIALGEHVEATQLQLYSCWNAVTTDDGPDVFYFTNAWGQNIFMEGHRVGYSGGHAFHFANVNGAQLYGVTIINELNSSVEFDGNWAEPGGNPTLINCGSVQIYDVTGMVLQTSVFGAIGSGQVYANAYNPFLTPFTIAVSNANN